MRSHHAKLFIIAGVAVLARCAQVAPLTGGPRDVTPPVLIESIPAANSTGVNATEIVFRFNEYVQVKDLSNQFIVTPRVDPAPSISADGRKVIVSFGNSALRPGQTYHLHFGNAIADMNESNPVRNFDYVFSTGASIDTLAITGTVKNALTGAPEAGALVELYEAADADSVIYKEKAPYYVRASPDGAFRIGNLPARKFRLYAVADQNKNELYDGHTEKIGFSPEAVFPGKDSVLAISMFQEEPLKGFIRSAASVIYGSGQIILNKKVPVEISLSAQTDAALFTRLQSARPSDTVTFFYRDVRDTLRLHVKISGRAKPDTLRIAVPRMSRRMTPRITTNAGSGKLAPGEKLALTFSSWMDTSLTEMRRVRFTSKEDTLLAKRTFAARWRAVNLLEFDAPLQEGMMYALRLDSAAFRDVHGNVTDSSITFFTASKSTDFGNLTLHILLPSKRDHVVQLLDAKGAVARERVITTALASTTKQSVKFGTLPAGDYSVRMIDDMNSNGKWDTGDVIKRVQPEKVYVHTKQIKVPADWDTEEEIKVGH